MTKNKVLLGIFAVVLTSMTGGCSKEAVCITPTQDKEARSCLCQGIIDIRITENELTVEGNAIAKFTAGTLDVSIVEEAKGVIPLFNLMAMFRKIEKKQSSDPSFVYVQVAESVPESTIAQVRKTLDEIGYPYYVRNGIWQKGGPVTTSPAG